MPGGVLAEAVKDSFLIKQLQVASSKEPDCLRPLTTNELTMLDEDSALASSCGGYSYQRATSFQRAMGHKAPLHLRKNYGPQFLKNQQFDTTFYPNPVDSARHLSFNYGPQFLKNQQFDTTFYPNPVDSARHLSFYVRFVDTLVISSLKFERTSNQSGGVTASTEMGEVKRHTGVHTPVIACKNIVANQTLAYAA